MKESGRVEGNGDSKLRKRKIPYFMYVLCDSKKLVGHEFILHRIEMAGVAEDQSINQWIRDELPTTHFFPSISVEAGDKTIKQVGD